MNAALNAEISRLTPTEKLQLVEALWTDLATNPEQMPFPTGMPGFSTKTKRRIASILTRDLLGPR